MVFCLNGIKEVGGSNPLGSTIRHHQIPESPPRNLIFALRPMRLGSFCRDGSNDPACTGGMQAGWGWGFFLGAKRFDRRADVIVRAAFG